MMPPLYLWKNKRSNAFLLYKAQGTISKLNKMFNNTTTFDRPWTVILSIYRQQSDGIVYGSNLHAHINNFAIKRKYI